jgi:DNA primase
MVRSLIEFGLKTWDEQQSVADHIFAEIEANQLEEMIDNKSLIHLVNTFKTMYEAGLEPNAKTFLYHEDFALSSLVVTVMDYNHEISPNWAKKFEGKIYTREDLYKDEVFSTLNYLKLRKIKRMMDENQRDMEKEQKPEEQMVFLQIHHHLKTMEIELTKQLGTVIFK